MRFTLLETVGVVQNRFRLLSKGDKTGVSAWWLSTKMPIVTDFTQTQFNDFDLELKNTENRKSQVGSIVDGLKHEISPQIWNAGSNLLVFLSEYISQRKPQVIFETGVANGATTLVIQDAITRENTEFHSVDINHECSSINEDSLYWKFHHLKGKNLKKSLEKILKDVPSVDLWIHDSDHHYVWQKFEYELALKNSHLEECWFQTM